MAAERDQAGASGLGMSGAGRDAGGSMGDRSGSAEVHSGLHSGTGESYSGLQFASQESQATGSASRLRGAAETVRDRVTKPARDLGARASEATSGARERLSGLRERTNSTLENRGLLDRLRENPLPLLGVAFALGFVLAGGDDADDLEQPTRGSRARRELRGALMAGVSAGIAQGARGFLNQAGSQGGGFVNGLLDNLMDRFNSGDDGFRSTSSSKRGRTGTGSRARPAYSGTRNRPPSHQEY
jgi:hypothetical protein